MSNQTLPPKLLLGLLLGFIGFTIMGTLLHEMGHWLMAKQYGFQASIHYNHTSFDGQPLAFTQTQDTIYQLHRKYHLQRPDRPDFPEKVRFEALLHRQQQVLFPITLGGPAQTMLTGSLGAILLLLNPGWWRAKQALKPGVWLVIFAALFWLRQSFNLALSTFHMLTVGGRWATQMDETKLSLGLHWWPATLSIVSGVVGLGILVFVTWCVVPFKQRLPFIIAGLIGGAFGFWLWLIWLGPKLLP